MEHFEWDAESLSVGANAPALAVLLPITVTWRSYSTSEFYPEPQTQDLTESRVFCGDLGLATYHQERVMMRKDGRPGTPLGLPIESSPAAHPTIWAAWDSTEGKLIRSVCQAVFPGWVPDFLAAQVAECANKASGLCGQGNRDLASSISLLLHRKTQAASACTSGLGAFGQATFFVLADEAITDVLAEAQRCQDAACRMNVITWMLSGLNTDLARAARGQPCEAISQRIARMERDKQTARGAEGMRAYLACAMGKVTTLDDGVSSAESVATALHSACLPVFDAAANLLLQHLDSRQVLASQFRPKLIEIVLQHRAASRGPQKSAPRQESGRRIQS